MLWCALKVDGAVMFHVTSVVLQLGLATLMWASAAGQVKCVRLLLDRGAQTNLQTKASANQR